jgi:hypothetical protein
MARALEHLLQVRCDATFLKALDDWRRQQEDIPSRAEAIRRLVEQALSHPPPTP